MNRRMKFVLFVLALITFVIPIIRHFSKENRTLVPQMTDGKKMDCTKLKECLDMNNSWIANCDQKAGILIATIGVAFTIFLTSDAVKLLRDFIFQPFLLWYNDSSSMNFDFSRFSVFVFLLTTVAFAGISMWFLFNSIKPNINYDKLSKENPLMAKKSYIFYGSVANMSYEEFKTAEFDYENDLRSQVYTNAKIAYKKFCNYLIGFFWFKLMMLSALFLFVSVMVMK